MTVKEVREKLFAMSGNAYDQGDMKGGFAYDMAQLMLREVNDHSEEMVEWIKRMLFWASVDVSNTPEYRDGVSYVCREFFRKFAKPQSGDPFHIRGWDYDA